MLAIFKNENRFIKKDLFGLSLTDVMFIGVFTAVASIPVEPCYVV